MNYRKVKDFLQLKPEFAVRGRKKLSKTTIEEHVNIIERRDKQDHFLKIFKAIMEKAVNWEKHYDYQGNSRAREVALAGGVGDGRRRVGRRTTG
jgi:hypothetical protein